MTDDVRLTDEWSRPRPGRPMFRVPDPGSPTGEAWHREAWVHTVKADTAHGGIVGFVRPGSPGEVAALVAVLLFAGRVTDAPPASRDDLGALEVAAARAILDLDAQDLHTDEARDRLARATQRHALAFLATLDPWPFAMPDTDDLEGEPVDALAALANLDPDTGVSALSLHLAAYLRGIGAEAFAAAWLDHDRELQAAEAQPALDETWGGGALDLPGWTVQRANSRTTAAWWWLTRAVLACEVRALLEAERPLYTTTMALLPLAEGWADGGRGAGGEWGARWDVSGVDPTLVRTIEQRGTLATVEAHALWRRLPDVARLAANAEGRAVALYSAPGGYVSAHATRGHRTEVEIRGGWQVFAAWLGYTGGKPRTALKAAAHALAGASYRWHAKGAGDVEGTLTLVSDLVDDGETGRVSFLLPRLWWPGFARELAGKRDRERGARALIPMPPTLPPSTSTRLGEGPARLETGALLWLRDHLGELTPTGAPVPWERLADDVCLSTAKQRSRRTAVLEGLLALWEHDGRWHREGELWRPDYGWAKLLEAQESEEAGRRRAIEGRKRRNPDGTPKRRRKRAAEK